MAYHSSTRSLALTMLAAGLAWNLGKPGCANEIKIVVPNVFADVEADALIGPLPEAYRVQYLYDASEFTSVPADNNIMTKLSWRPDGAQEGPISFTSERMIMRLSTTSKSPADIDSVLDNNVTSEAVVVFDAPWNITSQNTGPMGGPKEFDFTVLFQQPFVYDPSQGNVLVDFTVFGSSADFFGDFTVPLDVPSRAIWTGADVNSATSTGDIWGGAVIEFTFVPEPSTLVMAVFGLFGLLPARQVDRTLRRVSWSRAG